MSRTERRTREQVAAGEPRRPEQPAPWGEVPLSGLGLALVPGSATKWFVYRCWSDGRVDVLTPLSDGKLRGEGQWPAAARLKREQTDAMMAHNESRRVA